MQDDAATLASVAVCVDEFERERRGDPLAIGGKISVLHRLHEGVEIGKIDSRTVWVQVGDGEDVSARVVLDLEDRRAHHDFSAARAGKGEVLIANTQDREASIRWVCDRKPELDDRVDTVPVQFNCGCDRYEPSHRRIRRRRDKPSGSLTFNLEVGVVDHDAGIEALLVRLDLPGKRYA